MFTASQGLLFLRKFLAFHWHNYKAHSKKLTKAKNLNSLYLLQNEKKKKTTSKFGKSAFSRFMIPFLASKTIMTYMMPHLLTRLNLVKKLKLFRSTSTSLY